MIDNVKFGVDCHKKTVKVNYKPLLQFIAVCGIYLVCCVFVSL